MTILLGFDDYGTLNRFDDNVMDCIQSFLSPTPNEKLIVIHQQMRQYKFRPYKKRRSYGNGLMSLVAYTDIDRYLTGSRSNKPFFKVIYRDGRSRMFESN